MKMELQTFDYPKLVTPTGKKANHSAILKIVTTNICGSDQHIYHGPFAAPKGMVMGHEMTGEVIEVGPDVEFIKSRRATYVRSRSTFLAGAAAIARSGTPMCA